MGGRLLTILVATAAWLAMPAGSPELARNVDLVRVLKSERRLELLAHGQVVRKYSISLGSHPVGRKRFQGDRRTPEGRYLLDWRNAESCCVKSLHISYPNAADTAAAAKKRRSPGGMIMIHGPPNRLAAWDWLLQMFDWTDGCIAVSRGEMLEIWSMVRTGTPIEIKP